MAKRKLFKVAKEFNLGKDTLLTFLEKQAEEGVIDIAFKGINTTIDDDIYQIICDKFEREREQAEKLHRKKDPSEDEETTESSEETNEDTSSEAEAEIETEAASENETEEVVEEEKIETAEAVAEEAIEEEKEELVEAKTEDFVSDKVDVESPKIIEEEKKDASKSIPEKAAVKKNTSAPSSKPPVKKAIPSGTPAAPVKPIENAADKKSIKKRKALEKLKRQGKDAQLTLDRMIRNEEGANYRKKKTKKKSNVTEAETKAAVKKNLTNDTLKKKRKKVKKKQEDGTEIEVNVIKISEFMSTQDIAHIMDVPVGDIIKKCMLDLNMMVSINQRLDMDTIRLLAESYEYEIEEEEEFGSEFLEESFEDDKEVELQKRHPVVTVMGHVDHGKTSLLDYIRDKNVVAGESGGITQHIGAYEVELENHEKITFLDTPGHEAFTAMRARGAQATDIVILIVSADDGVMPQTKEAIDHTRAAGVPMIVAISKVDKPNANTEKVIQQLSEYDILVEDWGGKYQCAKVSAKSGEGISDLLEKILIESELLELEASEERRGKGVVIETQVEKGKGTVATILVQDGTVRTGDPFIIGQFFGKVKALFDERGHNVESVGPAKPIQVLGIDGIPQAGDRFIVMDSISKSRDIALKRQQLKREQDFRTVRKVTLEDISHDISMGGIQDLNIIVKGDVDGSVEALSDALIKLSHDEIRINVIRKAVGAITENDVILASASNAIIIGFHVRASNKATNLADKEDVQIRIYKIVYDAIDEVKDALQGMLRPEIKENVIGEIEISEVFKISKIGNIAGCRVTKGIVKRDSKIRLFRDGIQLHEGTLSTLKRFKDDVKEVKDGFECGLTVEGFNDIKVGDIIEAYETVEVARKLD